MDRIKDKVLCNPTVKLTKGCEYPFVGIDKITSGNRDITPTAKETYTGQSCSKFRKGDTIMARITPCLENGKIARYNLDSELAMGSTELFVFREMEKISDNNYIYYLISTNYVRNNAVNSMTGASGRQRADIKFIGKLKWNFPEYDIQCRIGKILSTYDDLIEKNNRKIQILQEMAEELYKEWFVRFRFPGYKTAKFENGIPKDWDIDKLRNKVNRLPFNRLYKEADLEKEGEVIVIDQSEKEFLGFHNNEPSHVANIDEPICLFGDHSCKFKLMSEPFSLGENVIPFKGQGINSYYLFYATHKIIETEEYKRHWGLFVSKKILIPPEPLQIEFAEFVMNAQEQITLLEKAQRLLIKQRDLLLPRLMSGKLEVKGDAHA